MSRPFNPFDPSRPIDPSRFIGRTDEIEELEAALLHAKHDRPRHFLITGERGIGKTSFLDFIRRRAVGGEFSFAVIDFSINKQTTRLDFARALKTQLESILVEHPTHRETFDRLWSFIQRFEIAGISYQGQDRSENHRDLYQEVADALCEVVKRICISQGSREPVVACDGVLILVDEIDRSSDELDIGSFLKYLLERLNRKECHKVLVGLAGLSESRDVLVRSHASSLRIFDELPLVNLDHEEVSDLLDEVQVIVSNEGFGQFVITADARDELFRFSGGHPHMLHQLGYCAFEKACSGGNGSELVVERGHVISGAFGPRGALDLIGDMYFRKPFHEIADRQGILQILDYLSEVGGAHTVTEISDQVELSELEVRESLDSLLRSGLLILHAGGRIGFRHPAFAYWIKAQRPQ